MFTDKPEVLQLQNVSTTIPVPTLNTTMTTLNSSMTTLNSSMTTLNSSVTTEVNWWNSSSYWNVSVWSPSISSNPSNPYCPNCYPQYVTEYPAVVYYNYSYIYYCLLLLLLVVAIICVKLGVNRRNQLIRQAAIQRRRAQQQVENANVTPTPPTDNNSSDIGPKETDSPPAYDDVMQSYLNAKQNLDASNVEAAANTADDVVTTTANSTNNISNAISTITIETDISSNYPSNIDLNVASSSPNLAARSEILLMPTSAPAHSTNTNVMGSEKSNNDHIV